jgi:hypothetical protein
LAEDESGGGRFGTADESPAVPLGLELIEEGFRHQQRLISDETAPVGGITIGIATEVEVAEHTHEAAAHWHAAAPTFQQLETGIPVVVPKPFRLEDVDVVRARPPAAVVMNGFLQRPSVAACDIPDDTVDVEQQEGGFQEKNGWGGW